MALDCLNCFKQKKNFVGNCYILQEDTTCYYCYVGINCLK